MMVTPTLKRNFRQFLNNSYGIGIRRKYFLYTMCGTNFNYNLKLKKYYNKNLRRIKFIIYAKSWILNEKLKQCRLQKFYLYSALKTFYKFLRFKFGLPTRGQRTHSNRQSSRRFWNNHKFLRIDATSLSINEKKKRRWLKLKKKSKLKFKFSIKVKKVKKKYIKLTK